VIQKARVLVVDDNRANLLALEAVLEKDFDLVLAKSGAESIDIIQKRQDIAVILMDVQMPEMDGFQAATQIKKIPACKDIPIIFLTAVYREDPYVKKGYETGGIDYLTKPFDPDILRTKVAIYASHREKADLLKERERHIRESEELLRVGRKLSAVLESLPVGVMIADVEGRICEITEDVARVLGLTGPAEADAYGQILGWWDADGKAIKDAKGPLARALNRGERSHSEQVRIRCLDGSSKTILASASPLQQLDGAIVGAVVLIQDVTESKKIEEALEEQVNKLIALGVQLEERAIH
jgi:PAS domain S-box-containing protein